MDQLDMMMEFENGTLEPEKIVELFQGLVDSGLAWQLQGMYGRTADRLIRAGLVADSKHRIIR